jgi:hypothetical protein
MVKIGLAFGIVLAAASCSSDSSKDAPAAADASTVDAGPPVVLGKDLTPAAETPPCTMAGNGAGGHATVTISGDGKTIMATVSYSNLSGAPTAAHIHFGGTTAPGPDVLDFASVSGNPITQTFTATDFKAGTGTPSTFDGFVLALKTMSNVAYVNIHTSKCQDGEIRGELSQ